VSFQLGFVVVIVRSDTAKGRQCRKTFVLLDFEKVGKYRKYNPDVETSVTSTRKYYPFKLQGKPVGKGESWVLKALCGTYNHDLTFSLVGHPYVGTLKPYEHVMLVDMKKSLVKLMNILLTLKENNKHNVTTIEQVYSARYAYKRSVRGPRIELQ